MTEATSLITLLTGVILFFRGMSEYKKNNRIKRAEFLDKLIKDFNAKESDVARYLLDGYQYIREEDRDLPFEAQMEHVQPLEQHLRNHEDEPIRNTAEIKVRRSFDHLLDFFTRLSYYLKQELISPAELSYFRYYIHKAENNEAVRKYIRTYFYEEDFILLFNSIEPDVSSILAQHLPPEPPTKE